MSKQSTSEVWSQRFGLARSPMFESREQCATGEHHVLLDGGFGSFGLSVLQEKVDPISAASWAWSSDLPHHVAVVDDQVSVTRWDNFAEQQTYTLKSIEANLDGFYRYLTNDRLRSNRNVVQHLVSLFGRIRSLVSFASLPDDRTIDTFLAILTELILGEIDDEAIANLGLSRDAKELRNSLSSNSVEELLREIKRGTVTLSSLTLHPNLALRHAGGLIFQEAHFDLVRAPAPDLFGYVESATSNKISRGGAHFTPPALARSIVDFSISQLSDISKRKELTICDPACGSGAFLHEALRSLRRNNFNGRLKVVGRDISAAAISMARFTIRLAFRDWRPIGGVEIDLQEKDSLSDAAFPSADLIVMNPPFISFVAQTIEQKEQLRKFVGDRASRRGDYCMAFISQAMNALLPGGVLGTLFPSSLLTYDASSSWRSDLAEKGDIRLIANIGDFGLFSQALVRVACVVFAKTDVRSSELTALVTENDSLATGDAFRQLRKAGGRPPQLPLGDSHWKLFAAMGSNLTGELPWRILTPEQRRLFDQLEARQTPKVGELFDIAQGIQTGNLKVFLLSNEQYLELPKKERKFFRKAIMTDCINSGKITHFYYIFFPHTKEGPLFSTEDKLASEVPTFYRQKLMPNKTSLKNRASILSSNRLDWWGLMRPRQFSFDQQPRILSKFFGSEGSFALDADAEFLPATGHVWMPKQTVTSGQIENDEEHASAECSAEVLRAYVNLLNSKFFMKLVSLQSVTVAGGQFDLSSRFLNKVYVPNLWQLATDRKYSELVRSLADDYDKSIAGVRKSRMDFEALVSQLYGVVSLAEF